MPPVATDRTAGANVPAPARLGTYPRAPACTAADTSVWLAEPDTTRTGTRTATSRTASNQDGTPTGNGSQISTSIRSTARQTRPAGPAIVATTCTSGSA